MGACGSGDVRKKHKKGGTDPQNPTENPNNNNNPENNENRIIIKEDEITDFKEKEIKFKNIPRNLMKTHYNYELRDLSKNQTYEDSIDSMAKINDLINVLNLRKNSDFEIVFENNMKIGYEKINEEFNEVIKEIFNNNIPEKIKMEYIYKGLDIPENMNKLKDAYIESNKIIGSVILDNQELFCVITYSKDNKLIKPYYYKRSDNEELIKFNSFTAFCNGKGKIYFSGGENEQTYDPDTTIVKYNDFFYVDLATLNENENKIVINELPNLNESRTWHSMIFVPNKYIFIVGGSNTKSVEIYDMETKEIKKDAELNEYRSESTLCLVNNEYLYAFCGFIIHREYNTTIERSSLLREKRKWEYVNINENPDFYFKPSFFGVSYFKTNEILLIGGNDNGEDKHYDYIYKIGRNEEEKDEIDEFQCNLNKGNSLFRDKFFMPIGDNKSVNIPLMIGEDIKIYILDTNSGDITIENYEEYNK